ncbi:sensor histidine kinase [Planococcus sp. CAU13]|uniref:sensor histidine kinase n=1 Tax=Planococcus sp. CAU13 TaxID=1541197 RepID=UPI00052FFFE0|nr:HAMP domain-containing sensor histidine kinase [Planococcus sp. CAU13]
MKKFGITFKLFMSTSAIFILFYVLVLLAQLMVFPEFYEQRKIQKLEQDAASLASIYQDDPTGIWESDSTIMRRLAKSGTNFTLTDFEGNITANDPFRMQVMQNDGTSINISLYFIVSAYRQEFEQLEISAGQEIVMHGEFGDGQDSNTFYPYFLQNSDGSNAGVKDFEEVDVDVPENNRVRGMVEKVSLPNLNNVGRRLGILYLAMDEFFPLSKSYIDQLNSMKPVELKWLDSFSGSRSGVIIQPVRNSGGEIELLFLVTSLQEIKETNSALRVLYAYLGAGGLVLILLLSTVYSRMVTRPLLLLNKRAEKIKNLDFSEGELVQRKDELGSLSNTLFEMSSKLELTLEELNKANERLKSEIKQNKELEQLQKDFFANASHELKTPISIVRGFAEGIRDGINTAKKEHYINVILEESEKMERLVQDMLDLLHLESPAVKLYKSPVLLSEITEDTLQKLVHQMEKKRLTARVVRNKEQEIVADAGKMEQVVQNLMTNAIRHAEFDSTIVIVVSENDNNVTYSVHNKGERIPDAFLNRIWERFFRAEVSRDRKFGGTGLGLAIVKRILELHECEYKAENKDDGVTFTLKFRK